MTQKFTEEEVRAIVKSLTVAGCSNAGALTHGIKALNAYADTLSKPADSGRVSDEVRGLLSYVYGMGASHGHHYTVEGGYTAYTHNEWRDAYREAIDTAIDEDAETFATLAAHESEKLVPCPVPGCSLECGICDGTGSVSAMTSVAWRDGFDAAALAAQGQGEAATRAAVKAVAYGAGMREALSLIAEHAEGATGQSGMGMDSGWVGETARAALGQGGAVNVTDADLAAMRSAAMEIQHNKEVWFPMTERRLKRSALALLARHTHPAPPASPAGVPDEWRKALAGLLRYVDNETCTHETTHRGGAIWTICDDCGQEWADDRGGFKPYEDAPEVATARHLLAATPSAPKGDGGAE